VFLSRSCVDFHTLSISSLIHLLLQSCSVLSSSHYLRGPGTCSSFNSSSFSLFLFSSLLSLSSIPHFFALSYVVCIGYLIDVIATGRHAAYNETLKMMPLAQCWTVGIIALKLWVRYDPLRCCLLYCTTHRNSYL
jgi:hypothetical protein